MDVLPDIVLIDWLSITSRCLSVADFQRLLGLEHVDWEAGNGAHGFKASIYFKAIKIFVKHEWQLRSTHEVTLDDVTADDDHLVWLDMSGSGCRAFETFGTGDFNGVLNVALSRPDCNITRLDVAFDDHSGLLDIDQLKDYTDNHWFVSKFRRGIVEYQWDRLKSRAYKAFTLYFGSEKSDVRIRIYDKAKERGRDELHWIRVETQFRHDNAAGVAAALIGRDVGQVYRGVLAEYLRFVVPAPDSNMRRWDTLPAWDALLNGVAAINIFSKPGLDYNLARLSHYTLDMAGAATYTLIRAIGITAFLDRLQNSISNRKLNPNYSQLLADLDVPAADWQQWEKEIADLRSARARTDKLESFLNSQVRVLGLREQQLEKQAAELSDAQLLLDQWLPLARSLSDNGGGEID